jgi:hypothetical protein
MAAEGAAHGIHLFGIERSGVLREREEGVSFEPAGLQENGDSDFG